MTAEWVTDHGGMRSLLRSGGIGVVVGRVTNSIAVHARSIAPVGGPEDPHAGRYRDSFTVVVHDRGDRIEGLVLNDAPEAAVIEFGSWADEAFHVMQRAASEGGSI